jgi:hypothetical protein
VLAAELSPTETSGFAPPPRDGFAFGSFVGNCAICIALTDND